MDQHRITTNPSLRWGTPCLGATGISVSHVIGLHQAGYSTDGILDVCPELTIDDIDAAFEWFLENGSGALGPMPPTPGDAHPRVAVDPEIQGGFPTIRGTRITVDAVLGLWEHGFTVAQILDEYPTLTADDVGDAVAYDREARSA